LILIQNVNQQHYSTKVPLKPKSFTILKHPLGNKIQQQFARYKPISSTVDCFRRNLFDKSFEFNTLSLYHPSTKEIVHQIMQSVLFNGRALTAE